MQSNLGSYAFNQYTGCLHTESDRMFSWIHMSSELCKLKVTEKLIFFCFLFLSFFLSFSFFLFFFLSFFHSRFLLVICFVHISVCMSIPISQFIPPPPTIIPLPHSFPLGVHTFVLYMCVSTSTLQISSTVPFF